MLKLVKHPNEILQQTLTEFDFDKPIIDPKDLEEGMVVLMDQENGRGLAANQVGVNARVFVMQTSNLAGVVTPFAVFNPIVTEASSELVLDEEGCLSYPDLFLKVKRPDWIIAQYQDSDGNLKEIRAEGYLAKCFQHEYDHLNGVCFVDRVSQMKLQLAMKKIRKKE